METSSRDDISPVEYSKNSADMINELPFGKEIIYKNVVESAKDFIFVFNISGKILYANNACIREAKATVDTLIGSYYYEYFDKNSATIVKKSIEKVYLTGRPLSGEHWITTPAKKAWLNTIFVPLLSPDENVYAVIGISRDLTYKKLVEETLKEKEEIEHSLLQTEMKYKIMIDNLVEGVILINDNEEIDYANLAIQKMIGYSAKQLIGRKIYEFMEEINRNEIREYIDNCKKGRIKPPYKLDCILITNRGKQIFTRINAGLFYDDMGILQGTIISINNITRQKKAEFRIRNYQAKLKKMVHELLATEEREKRKIAIALHDNVIQNLAVSKIELLEMATVTYNRHNSLAKVVSIIEETIQLVRNLTFDLYSPILIEQGLEAALSVLIDKINCNYQIILKVAPDIKQVMLEHQTNLMVFEMTRELLINSIKHAQATTIQVGIKKEESNMCICVEDDGEGFDIERKICVLNNNDHFGLFAVKERLDFVGGSLLIESNVGVGTKATIKIPLKHRMPIEENKDDQNNHC